MSPFSGLRHSFVPLHENLARGSDRHVKGLDAQRRAQVGVDEEHQREQVIGGLH